MSGTFDFAPGRHTWLEIAPDELSSVSFRGWEATSKPNTPYRPKYKLTLKGMRWYLNAAGNGLDVTTDPTMNCGRLRSFYIRNRQWDTFAYTHEVFGTTLYKFCAPVQIPQGLEMSAGIADSFEVMIQVADPGFF